MVEGQPRLLGVRASSSCSTSGIDLWDRSDEGSSRRWMFMPVIGTAWLPRLVRGFEESREQPRETAQTLELVLVLGLRIARATSIASGCVSACRRSGRCACRRSGRAPPPLPRYSGGRRTGAAVVPLHASAVRADRRAEVGDECVAVAPRVPRPREVAHAQRHLCRARIQRVGAAIQESGESV